MCCNVTKKTEEGEIKKTGPVNLTGFLTSDGAGYWAWGQGRHWMGVRTGLTGRVSVPGVSWHAAFCITTHCGGDGWQGHL